MALTAKRQNSLQRLRGHISALPLAAAVVTYAGGLAVRNAAGYITKGSAALNLIGIGRFLDSVTGGSSAGDETNRVEDGIINWNNSASTDQITIADIGKLAWIVDDETVAKTSGNGARSPAGIIVDVNANDGVWVLMDEAVTRNALAALKANLGTPTFVLGAEAGNVRNLAIQLVDGAGGDLAERGTILAYFSDDAAGDSVAATAFDTVAIGTDGLAVPLVVGKVFLLTSEADGYIDINITEDAAVTKYLILVMPNGRLVSSGAIAFA